MKLATQLLSSIALAMASLAASASPLLTVASGFGDPAGTDFGPGNVSFTTVSTTTSYPIVGKLTDTVTLGLTAVGRAGNAALTNNGHGTFVAHVGADTFVQNISTANSDGLYNQNLAKWDIGIYVGLTQSQDLLHLPNYSYKLTWDANPGAGVDLKSQTVLLGTSSYTNLGFDLLQGGLGFNPNAFGEYDFTLTAYNGDAVVASTSIAVQVVPEPASVALVGVGLMAVVAASRRRRKI